MHRSFAFIGPVALTLVAALVTACGGGSQAAAPPSAATAEAPKPSATTIDTTPIADPVANVPPTCAHGTKPAATGQIDDFEDGNSLIAAVEGRNGSWWVGKPDHAVIRIPAGPVKASAGGAEGGKLGMHFAGKTDNADPWGAAIGVDFLAKGFYDASKYAGISFKIKSASPNLDVRLKLNDVNTHPDGGKCSKQCFNAFGREIMAGPEWKEVNLMWSELTQQSDWGDVRPPEIDMTKIRDIEFQIWPGVDFDIWLDDLHFLECK